MGKGSVFKNLLIEGETTLLPETLCVTIRFRGSHVEAPAQYKKLLTYIEEHKCEISGFLERSP